MSATAAAILSINAEVQEHISDRQRNGTVDPTSAGVTDGDEIVRDFVAAGEWGCAVHHLDYLVDELALELDEPIQAKLASLRKAMGQ